MLKQNDNKDSVSPVSTNTINPLGFGEPKLSRDLGISDSPSNKIGTSNDVRLGTEPMETMKVTTDDPRAL